MEKGELKEYRLALLGDVLLEMETAKALPVSNINKLAELVMVFWDRGDYEKGQTERGYTWNPNFKYIKRNCEGIRSALVSKSKYLVYYRWLEKTEKGKKSTFRFRGHWKFVQKAEYKDTLLRENADIATRVDTHNQRIDDGAKKGKKWKLDVPHIAEVPLLTN